MFTLSAIWANLWWEEKKFWTYTFLLTQMLNAEGFFSFPISVHGSLQGQLETSAPVQMLLFVECAIRYWSGDNL